MSSSTEHAHFTILRIDRGDGTFGYKVKTSDGAGDSLDESNGDWKVVSDIMRAILNMQAGSMAENSAVEGMAIEEGPNAAGQKDCSAGVFTAMVTESEPTFDAI